MNLRDAFTSIKNSLLGEKGRDGFSINSSSPDYQWHKLFHEFLAGIPKPLRSQRIQHAQQPAVRAILDASPEQQVAAVRALIGRRIENERAFSTAGSRSGEESDCAEILQKLTAFLLRKVTPSNATEVEAIFSSYGSSMDELRFRQRDASALFSLCERQLLKGAMTAGLHAAITQFAGSLIPPENDWEGASERRTREQFEQLLAASTIQSSPAVTQKISRKPVRLDNGDAWAAAISTYVDGLDDQKGIAWDNVLAHALSAGQAKPSGKWLKEAHRLLEAVGKDEFKARIIEWFPSVRPSANANKMTVFTREPMLPANAELLRGLAWMCSCFDDEAVTRAVSDLGQSVYKKLPGWGPLSAKVGNACLFTLAQLPGLGPVSQLSRLRLKVKYSTALRLIDRALEEAAAKLGMTSDELEEIAVPTYGLSPEGCLREEFGDFTAEVKITGTLDTELGWIKADGKTQKSVPAEVKEQHAEDFKELKRTIQDIGKMLPAQRNRLERLLGLEREWSLEQWQERYLHQPLLAHIARRLIWHFRLGDRTGLGIWHEGTIVDHHDNPLDWLAPETRVRLWHPIGFSVENVSAWRQWLETHEVAQPFKQAHREVYMLTDAELNTNTYSNRFAGHIIKQHQFAALAKERGWKYSLQGGFDSHNTPTLELPHWNLSVEFWVDGGGNDLSPTGIYLYLGTDQVRFCNEGQPIPLSEVPALAFTEAMRDVDLFVGVCSIGNDPAWQDRGENGHQTYWHKFSFGDLSATAKTRREILEKLIPKLRIADRCSFSEKFLVVRGHLRTYKIHLGSGNILMEPNDQYLCIVPDRGSAANAADKIFLPFEGDNTMAVILSKAFLLTADLKIKDESILRQIRRT